MTAAGFVAKPASIVLLATIAQGDVTASVWDELRAFERTPGTARLCLTPLLEDLVLR